MITKEKLQHHLEALVDKHHDLELDLMEAHAHGDEINAIKIKKSKLKLKDEIETLKTRIGEMNGSVTV